MHRKIIIITSQAFSLLNFRGPLIKELVVAGSVVYALAPDFSDATRNQVRALGASPVDISLSRTGRNPLIDLADIFRLVLVMRRLDADIVLAYFVKPIIYGLIAARFIRMPRRFAIIEGLGSLFSRHYGKMWNEIQFKLVVLSYRVSLKGCKCVFFLNDDDAKMFKELSIVNDRQIIRIDGIGLDLNHYTPVPHVYAPITFMMVARMLREKGVLDFVAAARIVRAKHSAVRFVLLGSVDLNPDSIRKSELDEWVLEGVVEWPGSVNDVRPWLAQASVFVLPSYYREGIPRSTQEAMAMSRPVITTDWTGCRETVEPGRNGFLVPINNPNALAAAMEEFISHPEMIGEMGRFGRMLAEARFDVKKINAKILNEMGI
jgi:glycosyltransferase involved in cell wall biosynthesis